MPTITARISRGGLVSREATIGVTVQPAENGGGGGPTTEPLRPSLAEWLTSDEATGTPTKFVSNQNRGNGSGSSAANAQEVQAALNGASAGQSFVAVCQTPGAIEHWSYPTGLNFPNGASGNRIVLKARQGDGVVISAGQTYAAARTINNGFWTQSGLSTDDINKHIWRSTATFSGGEQALMGWWIEFDHPHQLLRYSSLANLRTAYGQEDSFTNYATPGVHKGSDGRVYIRMQKSHAVKYSRNNKWSESLWHGYPEAVTGGQIDYPKSQDPNDYAIYLTPMPTAAAFTFGNGWVRVGPGINSMGYRFALARGGTGVWLDRSTHYTWQLVVQGSAASALVANYYLNRVRASDGAKLHASRGEWKFGGPLEGIRSVAFQMGPGEHDSLRGLYLKDCTICDYHEFYTGAKNINNFAMIRMKNCTIKHIFDDGFQARHSTSRCEIGYCYWYNSDWGGMGDADADGNDPDPGEWYVHHNIFDWRSERNQIWRSEPHSQDCWTGHSPDGNSPRKIYNNLCLFGPDRQNGDTIGFEHCATTGTDPQANNDLTGAANCHQVFNNIIILQFLEGTKRYTPNLSGANYSIAGDRLQHDFIGVHKIRYSAVETNELFDYNLWWRPSGMTEDSPFHFVRGNSTTRTGYASLTAWHNSAEFDHSKLSGARRAAYTPGVEGNSVQIAPGSQPPLATVSSWPTQRLTGYRPSAVSSITTAASGSLNGQNWWGTPPTWGTENFNWAGLAPSPYKGPLDPNGTTMPVGVQNP